MKILIATQDWSANLRSFKGPLLGARTALSAWFFALELADKAVRAPGKFFVPVRGARIIEARAAVWFLLFTGLTVPLFGQNPLHVHTQPAKAIRTNSAVLNGMVLPGSNPATAWFEWGTSRNYGYTAGWTNLLAGNQVITLRCPLSDLSPNYVYHCRLVASNAAGVVRGTDQQFTLGASVFAWGNPAFGHTIVPSDLTNAVAISAGSDHCLALRNDGMITAWGGNFYGQRDVPGDVTEAIAVAGGQFHTLALLPDGTVKAWGAGTTFNPNPDSSNMEGGQSIVPADLTNVVQIAAGTTHSLALKADGTVAAWGSARLFINAWDPLDQSVVPAGLSNVVGIGGGDFHSMALKADGTVVVWGYDTHGQGVVPPGLTNVVAIAVGWYHNFAIKRDGTIIGWGVGTEDTGFPHFGQASVPPSLRNVAGMVGGGFYSLAVLRDGTATGWGADESGQASGAAGQANVVALAAGFDFSMALLSSAPLEVALTIQPLGNQLQLTWAGGVLQSANEVDGPFDDVPGATSPLIFTPTEPQQFYRLKAPP